MEIVNVSGVVYDRDCDGKAKDFVVSLETDNGGYIKAHLRPAFGAAGDVIGLTAPESRDDYSILAALLDLPDGNGVLVRDKILAVLSALA